MKDIKGVGKKWPEMFIKWTIFPQIVSTLEYFQPLNSFRRIYYIKVKFLRKLYENINIFQPQKRIVSTETIQEKAVFTNFSIWQGIIFIYYLFTKLTDKHCQRDKTYLRDKHFRVQMAKTFSSQMANIFQIYKLIFFAIKEY